MFPGSVLTFLLVVTLQGALAAAGPAPDAPRYELVESWPLENAVQASDIAPTGDFALLTYKGAPQGDARLEIQRFDLDDRTHGTITLQRGADGLMLRAVSEAAAIAIADDGATFLANWPAYLVRADSSTGVIRQIDSIPDGGSGMTRFNALEISPDGTAAFGVGGDLVRFDLSTGGLIPSRDLPAPAGQSLAVIGNSTVAVGGTAGGTLARMGSRVPECTIEGTINDLDVGPDRTRLAGAVYDQQASRTDLVVWSVDDCRELVRWPLGESFISDIAWIPGKNEIASADGDGQLRIWNAETGTRTGAIGVEDGTAFKMHFSDDARRLLTYTLWGDRRLRLFEAL